MLKELIKNKSLAFEEYEVVEVLKKDKIVLIELLYNKKINKHCICKTIYKDNILISNGNKVDLQNEAKILNKLCHKNIVMIYDFYSYNNEFKIYLEYCENKTLQDLINKKIQEKKLFTENEIINIFVQLYYGLYYIHSHNIIHRDLKPENIFIDRNNIIKIGDFGISKYTTCFTNTMVGCPYYDSPEKIKGLSYNKKVDIWSLGVILYQLINLELPFNNIYDLNNNINNINFKYFVNYSKDIIDFNKLMLEENPNKRISIFEFTNIKYFKNKLEEYEKIKQNNYYNSINYDNNISDNNNRLVESNPNLYNLPRLKLIPKKDKKGSIKKIKNMHINNNNIDKASETKTNNIEEISFDISKTNNIKENNNSHTNLSYTLMNETISKSIDISNNNNNNPNYEDILNTKTLSFESPKNIFNNITEEKFNYYEESDYNTLEIKKLKFYNILGVSLFNKIYPLIKSKVELFNNDNINLDLIKELNPNFKDEKVILNLKDIIKIANFELSLY